MGVLLAVFVAGILANMVASPRNPLAPLTCQLSTYQDILHNTIIRP